MVYHFSLFFHIFIISRMLSHTFYAFIIFTFSSPFYNFHQCQTRFHIFYQFQIFQPMVRISHTFKRFYIFPWWKGLLHSCLIFSVFYLNKPIFSICFHFFISSYLLIRFSLVSHHFPFFFSTLLLKKSHFPSFCISLSFDSF